MKLPYKILVLLLLCHSAIAQQKPTYFEGKDLKKYAGEWVGTSGDDTFKIILQYKEGYTFDSNNQNYKMDIVFGWHSYTKDGVTGSSNMVFPLDIKKFSIMMSKRVDGSQSVIFFDKERNKGQAIVSFTMVPGSNTKAIWKVEKIVPLEGVGIIPIDKNGKRLTQDKHCRPIPPPPPHETDLLLSKLTAIPEWTMTKVK